MSTHSTGASFRGLAFDQFVVQSLMIRLAMVVGDKFPRPLVDDGASPNGIKRFRHSSLIERTNRSA